MIHLNVIESDFEYHFYDKDGVIFLSLNKSIGCFLGFGKDFMLFENGSWYLTIDFQGHSISFLPKAFGTFHEINKKRFVLIKSDKMFVYSKNCSLCRIIQI